MSRRRTILAAAQILVLFGMASGAPAEERIQSSTTEATEQTLDEGTVVDWHGRVHFYGDVRLRYEYRRQEERFGDGQDDRTRYRLRLGVEAQVSERIDFGLKLRSGDPDNPVSNNTTLEGNLTDHDFSVAEAYASFAASDRVTIAAGRLDPGDWWTVSDLVWDGDFTVDGLMENVVLAREHGVLGGLEASFYQLLVEPSTISDAYLLGAQMRADFPIGNSSRLLGGIGYDDYLRPQSLVDATLGGRLRGNAVSNLLSDDGRLLSDFEVGSLFVTYENERYARWPVVISLFAYRNFGVEAAAKEHDQAFFARVSIGGYQRPGHVQVRYTRYDSRPDALLYVSAQSDTGVASDVDGHRLDVRIGSVRRSYFHITLHHARPHLGSAEPMRRLFLDYTMRF